MVDTFQWLTDTKNWYRIGLVFGGVALMWITIVGIGKSKVGGLLGTTAQSAGKSIGKKVTESAKRAAGTRKQ
jgi:hypothetical protein